jgi:Kef-type K+ transport system membrane component KefB
VEITQESILVVVAVAAFAPVVADLTPRIRVPIVIAEVLLGILVGPEVLGLAASDDFIDALSTFGLAFLFFLAGFEIDFQRIAGRPVQLGAGGWTISLALGLAIALGLWAAGVADAPVLVGLALTTTALGTLMPILRDSGVLGERLGPFIIGAGAVGELGPIVAVSVILAVDAGEAWRSSLLVVFAAATVVATVVALRVRPRRIVRLVQTTMHTSGQLAVRLSLVMIVALVVLAADLGLDIVLGAFAAGVVVGLVTRGTDTQSFDAKLDALGFGFLIPIFFIHTGMTYELDTLGDPSTLVLVPTFAALFLIVRGLPALLLYRRHLEPAEIRPLALFSAAGLPLIIAITEIGRRTGAMPDAEAAALVGAGMLSVLVYPILALALRRERHPT